MIFKSRYGGYYSGDRIDAGDVQMVRRASVGEVKKLLDLLDPHNNVNRHQIELVLMTLNELTPDGTETKAWKIIHEREKNGIQLSTSQ